MTSRCAIYARYSSEQQRDASIADQLRVCTRLARQHGWCVVEAYTDEAISGASRFRPGFQRLVQDAEAGRIDVVLCESLDRLGRKLADIADLFDRLSFRGVRIHTVQQGELTQMHVGVLGTMSQMFLSDLRAKTHRGLEGRVRQGRSGGGLCFGYRVVTGGSERGLRAIETAEAEIVLRIFGEYADGASPKAIAHRLNAEGVAGPRGGAWSPSAINGHRAHGTGVINNRLYVGELVWNKRRWIKDPATGKRVPRINDPGALVVEAVPELRIVPDVLWQAVRRRQDALDRRIQISRADAAPAFWSKQRPRYLFSGLMRCGACGGGFAKVSQEHFGCSTARNKGPSACSNRLTVRRDLLEETVLGALRGRLMDPDLFGQFVAEFTSEWNRLQAASSAGLAAQRQELDRVSGQIERLVDALADGRPLPAIRGRLEALEARRLALEGALAVAVAPTPRLHPNLAVIYRQRVVELARVLADEDGAEAREMVRGLVEAIRLLPEEGRLRIEVRGALGAIMALAEGAQGAQGARERSAVPAALVRQVKLVAGPGFEPGTFRL